MSDRETAELRAEVQRLRREVRAAHEYGMLWCARAHRWKAAAKVWRDRERIDALPPGYTKRQREQPLHYESQWPQVRPSKEVTDD